MKPETRIKFISPIIKPDFIIANGIARMPAPIIVPNRVANAGNLLVIFFFLSKKRGKVRI